MSFRDSRRYTYICRARTLRAGRDVAVRPGEARSPPAQRRFLLGSRGFQRARPALRKFASLDLVRAEQSALRDVGYRYSSSLSLPFARLHAPLHLQP